jgi:hypothetical protein
MANYEIACRYNYGDKFVKGPDYLHPKIDWQFPDLTPWTKTCIKHFSTDFFLQYKDHQFPTIQDIPFNTVDIGKAFDLCIVMMKSAYWKKNLCNVLGRRQK